MQLWADKRLWYCSLFLTVVAIVVLGLACSELPDSGVTDPGDDDSNEEELPPEDFFGAYRDIDDDGYYHHVDSCMVCHKVFSGTPNLRFIPEILTTPNSGDRDVIFLARSGQNSFADGDETYDGVCEVCHTTTRYHRNNSSGDHSHYTSMDCISCHPHRQEFASSGGCSGEAHDTHTEGACGLSLACDYCHLSNPSTFQDGEPFETTHVCDECHSPGGVIDGVDDPAVGARSNWPDGVYDGAGLMPGKERWCAGCHDAGTSVVYGVSAPNVDRFYVSGHGRSGAGIECLQCHDVSAGIHVDGEARTFAFDAADYGPGQSGLSYAAGYRLRLVAGQAPLMIPANYNITFSYNAQAMKNTAFRLCFMCHDSDMILDDTPGDGIDSNFKADLPNPPRNYSYAWGSGTTVNEHVSHIMNYIGPFCDSDWDETTNGPGGSNGRDTMTGCFACHNVHGAMGSEGSSNEVHIRDGALAGRPEGFGFSYVREDGSGYPWVTSTGATKENSVGAILRYNTEVNNMCGGGMCHGNPSPPPGPTYDASGSSWGTYIEFYRP